MSKNVLWVSRNQEASSSYLGKIVWPIRHDEDLQALQDLAQTFGAEAKLVDGPTEIDKRERQGLVVGLGDDVYNEARLYADLTARNFAPISELRELNDSSLFPDVIVTNTSNLCVELIAACQPCQSRNYLAGLIVASDQNALHKVVLVRSAATSLHGPFHEQPQLVDVSPFLPLGLAQAEQRWWAGAHASGAEVKHALEIGAGVLTVNAHGDGIDVNLNSGILCTVKSDYHGSDPDQSPQCNAAQYCHRLKKPLDVALNDDRLISPDILSARILIMNVCWGVWPDNPAIEATWGLGARLAENHRVGAILTTFEVVITKPEDMDSLKSNLSSGEPLGEAATQYLETYSKLGTRLCLLGDPKTRISTLDEAPPVLHFEPLLPLKRIRKLQANLQFMRAYVEAGLPKSQDMYSPEDLKALAAIEASEKSLKMNLGFEETYSDMLATTLDVILRRGVVPSHDWFSFAYSKERTVHHIGCEMCGASAQEYEIPLTLASGWERRFVICPVCGIVEDAPVAAPRFKLIYNKRGQVQLSGFPQGALWSAAFVVAPPRTENRVSWQWSADAKGDPAKQMDIEIQEQGLHFVALIINSEYGLTVLRRPGL